MLYIWKYTTSNGKYNKTGERKVGEDLEGSARGLTQVLSGPVENSFQRAGFPAQIWSRHF